MQCASCRFENMPGTRNCARCGSSMELTTQVIDVHPPRARRWSRPARKFSRTKYALSSRVSSVLARAQAVRFDRTGNAPPLTLDLAIRLLIPGWAQFHLRRPGRGYVFMIGASIAAIIAILFVGTGYGSLALGTLFSLHAASISDAIVAPGCSMRENMANGIMVYIVLGLLLYLPSIWLISRVAVPYHIQQDIAPFQEGDVLLVRPHATWKRGDIVTYSRNGGGERIEIAPLGGEHRYVRLDGIGIDRILGIPGDHLSSNHGVLTVNGSPLSYGPILHVGMPSFDVVVPAGRYFIWPSVAATSGADAVLIGVADTPAENVTGRVFFRSYPWSRAGFIR